MPIISASNLALSNLTHKRRTKLRRQSAFLRDAGRTECLSPECQNVFGPLSSPMKLESLQCVHGDVTGSENDKPFRKDAIERLTGSSQGKLNLLLLLPDLISCPQPFILPLLPPEKPSALHYFSQHQTNLTGNAVTLVEITCMHW